MILDEGRIVERGARDELLAAPDSRLYRLYGALQQPRGGRHLDTARKDDTREVESR